MKRGATETWIRMKRTRPLPQPAGAPAGGRHSRRAEAVLLALPAAAELQSMATVLPSPRRFPLASPLLLQAPIPPAGALYWEG